MAKTQQPSGSDLEPAVDLAPEPVTEPIPAPPPAVPVERGVGGSYIRDQKTGVRKLVERTKL